MATIFNLEELENAINAVEELTADYDEESKEYVLSMVLMRLKRKMAERKGKEFTARRMHDFIPKSFLERLRDEKERKD